VGEGVAKVKAGREAKEVKEAKEVREVVADLEGRAEVKPEVAAGPAVLAVKARRAKREPRRAMNSLRAIVPVDPTQPLQLQRRSAWLPRNLCKQSHWPRQDRFVVLSAR
jgi:hypothetical protein